MEAQHREHGWRGKPEQYGAAGAILLGDLLLGWADELLGRCGLPPERVAPAHELFAQCRSEVIAGQFLDVSVQARASADVDAAMTVLRYKSAKYSIERPLQIGAALAGAGPELLTLSCTRAAPGRGLPAARRPARCLRRPERDRQARGDDLIEGKRTVLVALALDAAPFDEAKRLDHALGRPLAPADVEDLRGIIYRSGAHAQVESVITQLAERATSALDQAPVDEHARAVLRGLATAATQRTV